MKATLMITQDVIIKRKVFIKDIILKRKLFYLKKNLISISLKDDLKKIDRVFHKLENKEILQKLKKKLIKEDNKHGLYF